MLPRLCGNLPQHRRTPTARRVKRPPELTRFMPVVRRTTSPSSTLYPCRPGLLIGPALTCPFPRGPIHARTGAASGVPPSSGLHRSTHGPAPTFPATRGPNSAYPASSVASRSVTHFILTDPDLGAARPAAGARRIWRRRILHRGLLAVRRFSGRLRCRSSAADGAVDVAAGRPQVLGVEAVAFLDVDHHVCGGPPDRPRGSVLLGAVKQYQPDDDGVDGPGSFTGMSVGRSSFRYRSIRQCYRTPVPLG